MEPHVPGLLAYLARMTGERDEAKDLLQEALIRAWLGLATYEHDGRLGAWLFTIARNLARDRDRRRRRVELVTVDARLASHEPDPLEQAVAGNLERDLQAALNELPEARRTVFLLRKHSTMTYQEIADTMEIPLGTALSHMHHAIRSLREALRHHAP